MPKSPEDVALPYSVQIAELIFEAKENGGKLPRPINPIIAAAIREDRAEMVSEAEVEEACKAWSGTWGHEFPGELQGSDIHDHAANCVRHTMRVALDAARKARAG